MKKGCNEPVDSESNQVLEPETNNLMTMTNVIEGYEQVLCLRANNGKSNGIVENLTII